MKYKVGDKKVLIVTKSSLFTFYYSSDLSRHVVWIDTENDKNEIYLISDGKPEIGELIVAKCVEFTSKSKGYWSSWSVWERVTDET